MSALAVILVCQAYIQCQTGFNLSFTVTFKHSFVAVLIATLLSLAIPIIYYKKDLFNILPANYCFLVLMALFINVGFMIKEQEQTFPLIVKLVTKPSSIVLPEGGSQLQMYPSWLEMYPVNE